MAYCNPIGDNACIEIARLQERLAVEGTLLPPHPLETELTEEDLQLNELFKLNVPLLNLESLLGNPMVEGEALGKHLYPPILSITRKKNYIACAHYVFKKLRPFHRKCYAQVGRAKEYYCGTSRWEKVVDQVTGLLMPYFRYTGRRRVCGMLHGNASLPKKPRDTVPMLSAPAGDANCAITSQQIVEDCLAIYGQYIPVTPQLVEQKINSA